VEHARWGGAPRRDAVGSLLGLSAPEIEEGAVTFTMPRTGWLAGSDGRIQPGVLAMLADAAHATAVLTTLARPRFFQTLGLTFDFVGSPDADAGELRCRTTVARADADDYPVVSYAAIEDAGGRLIAHTTARTVLLFEIPLDHVDPPDDPSSLPPLEETTRPYREDVVGAPLASEALAGAPPLDLLERLVSGDAPLPPIYHLTGLRPAGVARGEAVFTIPATEWLASFAGNVYGGVLGLLLEASASGAVWSMLSAGQRQHPVDLKVSFVRPVPADGEPIFGEAKVVQCGERVAVATSEALTADGQTVAIATSTHLVAQAAASAAA
jgi:uncharacterized protein (TIGR00369 family)